MESSVLGRGWGGTTILYASCWHTGVMLISVGKWTEEQGSEHHQLEHRKSGQWQGFIQNEG